MIDVSKQEALLLLKKWRESSALLRIILHSSGGILNAIGVLGGSDELLEIGDARTWLFSSSIGDMAFRFGTSEEAPPTIHAKSLEKYESLLEITFTTGEHLALMEIKEPHKMKY